jgi:hypothetical protein
MNTQKIRNLFQSIPKTGVSIMDFLGVGPSERVDVIYEYRKKGTGSTRRRTFPGVKLPLGGGFKGWPERIGITFRAACDPLPIDAIRRSSFGEIVTFLHHANSDGEKGGLWPPKNYFWGSSFQSSITTKSPAILRNDSHIAPF